MEGRMDGQMKDTGKKKRKLRDGFRETGKESQGGTPESGQADKQAHPNGNKRCGGENDREEGKEVEEGGGDGDNSFHVVFTSVQQHQSCQKHSV